MSRLLLALVLTFSSVTVAIPACAASTFEQPFRFDFQGVAVSQVVGLVYMQAIKTPYVIDPAVLQDARMVSFRFDSSSGQLRPFWGAFLDSLGLMVTTRAGVDFVTVKPAASAHVPQRDLFVYRPKYRSVSYLVDLLSTVFTPTSFVSQRSLPIGVGEKAPSGATPGTAAAVISTDSDTLVFQGSAEEVRRFKAVLPQVDTAIGEVMVEAVVYEVSTGSSDSSAFSLAVSMLGHRLGVSVGGRPGSGEALTISSGNIEAALSVFKGDSRFKAVSTPTVRVRSGEKAQLMVGQEVPTLGAISYPQTGGAAVQAVEYRSSGFILTLLPTVRQGGIDMMIDQQISDFATTSSGVNNSPTLTKRSLSTSVTALDGELILLGGLTQNKDAVTRSGQKFLPSFMRSSGNTVEKTEVLLMLQVTKI